MIKFENGKQVYRLRNKPNEITLLEMSKVAAIMKNDTDRIDMMLKIVDVLGDKGLSDVISITNLFQFANNFQNFDVKKNIKKSITVNGRKYVYNAEPSAKAMKLVEKNINSLDGLVYVFAVAYEDEQLTIKEHTDAAHIKHKAAIFGDAITSDIATPVCVKVTELIIQNAQQLDESLAVAGAE
jgi:hypothetical protein